MKRTVVGLIILISLVLAGPVMAAQFISEKGLSRVEKGQTVDDDVFMTGETLVIDGTVNGDVYATGELVTINGTVNGDVYALSSRVEVKGIIRDDLLAAGQLIAITGKVGDSITAAGETITAEKSATIGGGVLAAASEFTVRSSVGRGVVAAADKIVLDGAIGRQALLAGTTITLNSGTKINGDLRYRSDESLIKNQGSQINGQTIRHTDPGPSFNWGWVVWSFVSLALVGLIMIKLMPTAVPAITSAITNHSLPVLGWGLVAVFLSPPLILLLLISIIGIPLSILTAILFGVLLYLSHAFTAMALGSLVSRGSNSHISSYASFLMGLAILTIAGAIPLLGMVTSILAALFGLGGVLYYAKNRLAVSPQKHSA